MGGEAGEGGPSAYWTGILHVQGDVEGRGELAAAAPGAAGGRGGAEFGVGWRGHDVGCWDRAVGTQRVEGQRPTGAGVIFYTVRT